MARVTWWILPVACVVLARVVTLDGAATTPASAPPSVAGEPAAPSPLGETQAIGPVVLRDATGSARHAAVLPGASFAAQLPSSAVGSRVDFRLERVGDNGTRSPWITGTPRVPKDGVLRFAGLPAGIYAVRVQWGSGDGVERRSADRCEVPGTVDLLR